MLTYNQELIVDSDTHRVGNYYTNLYEFPSSEKSTVERRDKEIERMVEITEIVKRKQRQIMDLIEKEDK